MPAATAGDSEPACAVCASTEALKCCGRCRTVFYCCVEHQKADWKAHKAFCRFVAGGAAPACSAGVTCTSFPPLQSCTLRRARCFAICFLVRRSGQMAATEL